MTRLISLANGLRVDPWALIFFTAFLPAVGWFGYRVIDWSNDKYEVTNEQIIDIDREPFGTEVRNAAPLEGIMGTQYERKGFLGYIFNFGTVHITVGGTKMAFAGIPKRDERVAIAELVRTLEALGRFVTGAG